MTRLPLVHRNYVVQIIHPVILVSPSPEPGLPLVASSSNILANFGETLRVDWHLLEKLKDLILPYLLHTGELLKLK